MLHQTPPFYFGTGTISSWKAAAGRRRHRLFHDKRFTEVLSACFHLAAVAENKRLCYHVMASTPPDSSAGWWLGKLGKQVLLVRSSQGWIFQGFRPALRGRGPCISCGGP